MTNKIYLENLETMDYARREAYNSLRSNLMFSGPDIKTILFTSCNPDEGKSRSAWHAAWREPAAKCSLSIPTCENP